MKNNTKKVYKLTNQDNTTHNGFDMIPKKWYKTSGEGELCTNGWLHAYSDPLVASFMNSIHAAIINPKLWEAEGKGKFKDDNGLKCGFSELRIIKEIPFPEIAIEKRIEIATHCSIIAGYDNTNYIAWALHWLDGSDRTKESAEGATAVAKADAAWVAKEASLAAAVSQRVPDMAADVAFKAYAAAFAAKAAWNTAANAVNAAARSVVLAANAVKARVAVPPVRVIEFSLKDLLHELCD